MLNDFIWCCKIGLRTVSSECLHGDLKKCDVEDGNRTVMLAAFVSYTNAPIVITYILTRHSEITVRNVYVFMCMCVSVLLYPYFSEAPVKGAVHNFFTLCVIFNVLLP